MPEQDLAPVVPTPAALGTPATAVAAAIAAPVVAQADSAENVGAEVAVAEVAPVDPGAEGADFVERQLNTDTMRDLLKALGHDIGDVWDDVVKLAKKAI